MRSLTTTLLFTLSLLGVWAMADRSQAYNILLITIDDLRPQLGAYGDPIVKSPNLDRFAGQAMLFENAYCQYALCGPSRTSFLTGYYPRNIGVQDLRVHFREVKPEVVTLPQFFKNNGYHSEGLFKVFHLVGFAPELFGKMDDPVSWTRPHWSPTKSAWGPEGEAIYQASLAACLARGEIGYGNIPRGPATEIADCADSELSDGETAFEAISRLEGFAKSDSPFFLAVGFYHPHLPFTAPQKYWDMYDEGDLALPDNQFPAIGAPEYVRLNASELRSYPDIPDEGPFSEALKKRLLHGYLASISYVDAQVGLVLKSLEELGLRENTLVVILGDHGYQIGEHDHWCKKHCNFKMATHVPLMISVPDMDAGRNGSFVELLDIYPTLAELSGFDMPQHLDGVSLVPILKNSRESVRDSAFTAYRMGGRMGTSMITEGYRFTEWVNDGGAEYELYDHKFDAGENVNMADNPKYAQTFRKLNVLFEKEKKKRFGN